VSYSLLERENGETEIKLKTKLSKVEIKQNREYYLSSLVLDWNELGSKCTLKVQRWNSPNLTYIQHFARKLQGPLL